MRPSVALPNGTLILGTPYVVVYNNSDAVFYLRNMTDPYSIPLGGGLDFWGTTTPNSSFAFPIGQAISRTTYATLFSLLSTTYGVGDGSTTFNLPDKTGRVSAMKEASATRLTTAGGGIDGATLGAVGTAAQSQTLTLAQLPTGITVNGTVTVTANGGDRIPTNNTGSTNVLVNTGTTVNVPANALQSYSSVTSLSGSNTLTSNNTSGNAHPIVQPTIICNYIMRII
jgi:microcystin-dependent protein